METILKYVVLLGLLVGIVLLAINDLEGWGWLIFLFILTLFTIESNKDESKKD